MPTSLRSRLDDLASSFASEVLVAIRASSLEELLGATPGHSRRSPAAATRISRAAGGRASRLARRSATDISNVVGRIAVLLGQHPKGLRAEQIRRELGLLAKEMPRPLKEALGTGRLGKSGQKRATTYFLKSGGRGSRAGGPAS